MHPPSPCSRNSQREPNQLRAQKPRGCDTSLPLPPHMLTCCRPRRHAPQLQTTTRTHMMKVTLQSPSHAPAPHSGPQRSRLLGLWTIRRRVQRPPWPWQRQQHSSPSTRGRARTTRMRKRGPRPRHAHARLHATDGPRGDLKVVDNSFVCKVFMIFSLKGVYVCVGWPLARAIVLLWATTRKSSKQTKQLNVSRMQHFSIFCTQRRLCPARAAHASLCSSSEVMHTCAQGRTHPACLRKEACFVVDDSSFCPTRLACHLSHKKFNAGKMSSLQSLHTLLFGNTTGVAGVWGSPDSEKGGGDSAVSVSVLRGVILPTSIVASSCSRERVVSESKTTMASHLLAV